MPDDERLRVDGSGERWRIKGGWHGADLQLCNDYLGYLADRRYSPASVRAYAFDLLHFARSLAGEGVGLDAVDADALLRYLAAGRQRGARWAAGSPDPPEAAVEAAGPRAAALPRGLDRAETAALLSSFRT